MGEQGGAEPAVLPDQLFPHLLGHLQRDGVSVAVFTLVFQPNSL